MFNNLKNRIADECMVKIEKTTQKILHECNEDYIAAYIPAYLKNKAFKPASIRAAAKNASEKIGERALEQLKKLEKIAATPRVQHFTVYIEYKRNRTWGNYSAVATLITADGTRYTKRAHGAGYDKASHAAGACLNACAGIIRPLCDAADAGVPLPSSVTGLPPYYPTGSGLNDICDILRAAGYTVHLYDDTILTAQYTAAAPVVLEYNQADAI